MGEEIVIDKAYEVAELLALKYYKETLGPYLERYKSTVFLVLLEEENLETLTDMKKVLSVKETKLDDTVIH